jgi:hypothetical protein
MNQIEEITKVVKENHGKRRVDLLVEKGYTVKKHFMKGVAILTQKKMRSGEIRIPVASVDGTQKQCVILSPSS